MELIPDLILYFNVLNTTIVPCDIKMNYGTM